MKLMRALIVAPDEAARREVASLLDDCCFDCVEAPDGISALRFISDDAIDLIVADAQLPILDGPQFVDIVIEGAFGPRPPPLIVCATNPQQHAWVTRVALPGVALLTRPFTPGAFVAALDEAFPVE